MATAKKYDHEYKVQAVKLAKEIGSGKAVIDGETTELAAGDWLRISPKARRQFFAAADEGISYVCIQTKENSLEEYTQTDGVVEQ